jgi:pimeloyl-ACP methyl ester carboxylesterase
MQFGPVIEKLGGLPRPPRPILILHSARDRVCNFEEAFSLMRQALPPVELYLIDGVDHFMFVDPDPRVAFILRNWLDRFFPVKVQAPEAMP